MAKKIRSARGTIIDLDLMRIKSTMEKTPKPKTTVEREEFIDQKLRRHIRRTRSEQAAKIKEQKGTEPSQARTVTQPKQTQESTPTPKRRVRRKKNTDAGTSE